jgi:hypothetical protein
MVDPFQSIPAIMIGIQDDTTVTNLFDYWSPVFWHWSDTTGWEAFEFYYCTDVLAGAAVDMLQQFNTGGPPIWSTWLCPDIGTLNYTGYFSSWTGGSVYQITVEYCDLAAYYLNGSGSNCKTDVNDPTSLANAD